MSWISGRRVSLTAPRRFICDMMRASQRMPIISLERRMDLAAVVAARARLIRPPAWSLLFAKAFAIVAAQHPELRRAYVPVPWPHLWECTESVTSIAIERQYEGEPAVFLGLIKSADTKTLAELVATLDEWKAKPLAELYWCRRMLFYARLPLPLRRFAWWYGTAWSGKVKAPNFGTFGVSLTGSAGATATNLICPLTSSLNCGMIQPDGSLDVRLHFDHRVYDGMPAARALAEMEDVLRGVIVDELQAMPGRTRVEGPERITVNDAFRRPLPLPD